MYWNIRKESKLKKEVFKIPQNTNAGIYMLYNATNHRAYIGQTSNFHNRATMHKQNLLSNTHHNKKLQNDFNSGHGFIFVILEEVLDSDNCDELKLREKQYIFAFLDRYIKLYNHETSNQVKEYLFYHMIHTVTDKIRMDFSKKFSCQIGSLERYSKKTLEEKFSI
jgi:hypothetical protein